MHPNIPDSLMGVCGSWTARARVFETFHIPTLPPSLTTQADRPVWLSDSAEETKSGIGSALAMRVRVVFRVADGTHAYLAWCDDQANLRHFETTTAHGSAFVLWTIRAGAGPLDLSNGFQERHHEQVVRSLAEKIRIMDPALPVPERKHRDSREDDDNDNNNKNNDTRMTGKGMTKAEEEKRRKKKEAKPKKADTNSCRPCRPKRDVNQKFLSGSRCYEVIP